MSTEPMNAVYPRVKKPSDFEEFWRCTIAESRAVPLNSHMQPLADERNAYDIFYDGADGSRIHGIFVRPENPNPPVAVYFHGYGGKAGSAAQYSRYTKNGYAVLAIDVRGQSGTSENRFSYSFGTENLITSGLLDQHEYYMKWVITDCLRALDVASETDGVNHDALLVCGGSQGGGLSVTVAALDSRPVFCLCDVPSNSSIDRRVEGRHGMYNGVAELLDRLPHLRDRALQTLSYFDTVHMAKSITCPVFASVGLSDQVCPAVMFFATFEQVSSPKELIAYENAGHDGGGCVHEDRKFLKLQALFSQLNSNNA